MEKNLKCAHCDGFYKKSTATRIFLNKYIKEDVSILKCDKCGHELVPLDEVENVYQEIRRIEKANALTKFFKRTTSRIRMAGSSFTVL